MTRENGKEGVGACAVSPVKKKKEYATAIKTQTNPTLDKVKRLKTSEKQGCQTRRNRDAGIKKKETQRGGAGSKGCFGRKRGAAPDGFIKGGGHSTGRSKPWYLVGPKGLTKETESQKG